MPTFADVNIGDELPPVHKKPARINLVQYAAGSGDFNPLHFDADFPQARQIGDNIVHGRMKYASLGECVSNWLGHTGWVQRISCQYRGMDMQGQPFTVRGVVVGKRVDGDRKLVDIDVWTEDAQGNRTTPGTAVVVLDA